MSVKWQLQEAYLRTWRKPLRHVTNLACDEIIPMMMGVHLTGAVPQSTTRQAKAKGGLHLRRLHPSQYLHPIQSHCAMNRVDAARDTQR